MVADNDLALGRVVEAVSQSKFWPETCIFVVEDDPQNGFDHVDAHRTVALVISPYTRRKFVDSTCYNQTGMVKTIELILGLPPMNQLDLSATAMRDCFQRQPDLTPYTRRAQRIALDEMNPEAEALTRVARAWAETSAAMDFEEFGDIEEGPNAKDENILNRAIWYGTRVLWPDEVVADDEGFEPKTLRRPARRTPRPDEQADDSPDLSKRGRRKVPPSSLSAPAVGRSHGVRLP